MRYWKCVLCDLKLDYYAPIYYKTAGPAEYVWLIVCDKCIIAFR